MRQARVLVTEDPGYVLRVGDDQVDALRFQALARQAHEELAGGQARRCGRWPGRRAGAVAR